jgi:hypothetical protein
MARGLSFNGGKMMLKAMFAMAFVLLTFNSAYAERRDCYWVEQQKDRPPGYLEIRNKDDLTAPTKTLTRVSKFELHKKETSGLLNVTTIGSISGGSTPGISGGLTPGISGGSKATPGISGGSKATPGWIEEKFKGAASGNCVVYGEP